MHDSNNFSVNQIESSFTTDSDYDAEDINGSIGDSDTRRHDTQYSQNNAG